MKNRCSLSTVILLRFSQGVLIYKMEEGRFSNPSGVKGRSVSASDSTLWERWQGQRDPDAFAEIVSRHSGMVYAACKRILRDSADAEDVVQDCFLELLNGREQVGDKPVQDTKNLFVPCRVTTFICHVAQSTPELHGI